MRESTWKKPGGGPFLDDETSAWRVAVETAGDLVARWGPIVVVACVIIPATALAAEGEGGQYDRLVALLTALGVAAGNVYSAWNTARMKAQIRSIAGRRSRPGSPSKRAVVMRRGPVPMRSGAVSATTTSPNSPQAVGTIERLDQRITGLESSVADVKRDLTEVLDILTGGRRP